MINSGVGNPMVATSNNGGHPPEFWAHRATEHIVSVAETAPDEIREQARVFRSRVEAVILHYMREAIKSDRTTLQHGLTGLGEDQLASVIRKL